MQTTAIKTTWAIDPSHSELIFKVKHLMISNVKGEFRSFTGTVQSNDNDFSDAVVDVTIDASSIFTNDSNRDGHLKNADFFDVENHKELTFKGSTFKKLDDHNYQVKGLLTIKGISKLVTLDVEFGGLVVDPYGNNKAGFSISGKINRKDWGLNWNAALEAGGVMVSDEVKINAEVQLVKQAAQEQLIEQRA
jgi:polyisoprenoid-binding protein YceI